MKKKYVVLIIAIISIIILFFVYRKFIKKDTVDVYVNENVSETVINEVSAEVVEKEAEKITEEEWQKFEIGTKEIFKESSIKDAGNGLYTIIGSIYEVVELQSMDKEEFERLEKNNSIDICGMTFYKCQKMKDFKRI